MRFYGRPSLNLTRKPYSCVAVSVRNETQSAVLVRDQTIQFLFLRTPNRVVVRRQSRLEPFRFVRFFCGSVPTVGEKGLTCSSSGKDGHKRSRSPRLGGRQIEIFSFYVQQSTQYLYACLIFMTLFSERYNTSTRSFYIVFS